MTQTSTTPRHRSHPEPLGRLLAAVLKDLGLEKHLREHQAAQLWPSVVGEQLARISAVTGVERGKLFVHIKTSVWKDHFHRTMKADVIQEINRRMGRPVIVDIVLARTPPTSEEPQYGRSTDR